MANSSWSWQGSGHHTVQGTKPYQLPSSGILYSKFQITTLLCNCMYFANVQKISVFEIDTTGMYTESTLSVVQLWKANHMGPEAIWKLLSNFTKSLIGISKPFYLFKSKTFMKDIDKFVRRNKYDVMEKNLIRKTMSLYLFFPSHRPYSRTLRHETIVRQRMTKRFRS